MYVQKVPDRISPLASFFEHFFETNPEDQKKKAFAEIMEKMLSDKLYKTIQAIHGNPKRISLFSKKEKIQELLLDQEAKDLLLDFTDTLKALDEIHAIPKDELEESVAQEEQELEARLQELADYFNALSLEKQEQIVTHLLVTYGIQAPNPLYIAHMLGFINNLDLLLEHPQEDQIKYLKNIYRALLYHLPQAEHMMSTHAASIDVITQIFSAYHSFIARTLANSIIGDINKLNPDAYDVALQVLQHETKNMIISTLTTLLDNIKAIETTLSISPTFALEIILPAVFGIMITKDFSSDDNEKIFKAIAKAYQENFITTNFIETMLHAFNKLPKNAKTEFFKQQMLEYYWTHMPVQITASPTQ